jgi:hypothetical protein
MEAPYRDQYQDQTVAYLFKIGKSMAEVSGILSLTVEQVEASIRYTLTKQQPV